MSGGSEALLKLLPFAGVRAITSHRTMVDPALGAALFHRRRLCGAPAQPPLPFEPKLAPGKERPPEPPKCGGLYAIHSGLG